MNTIFDGIVNKTSKFGNMYATEYIAPKTAPSSFCTLVLKFFVRIEVQLIII